MSATYNFITEGFNVERLRNVLIAGADPNEIIGKRETVLHVVVSKNEKNPQDTEDCLQMARDLIAFGADVNAENDSCCTPLIIAAREGKWRMVELLLQAKANINHVNYKAYTALHEAVIRHCMAMRSINLVDIEEMRVVKTLLRFHPEMDAQDWCGYTPLKIAVISGDYQIVKELLRHNASVNFLDFDQNSVLHDALQLSQINEHIVLELVRHGGDFSIRNSDGQTPLDVYINRQLNSSSDAAKKAKVVFKLYILSGNPISPTQQRLIDGLRGKDNCQLSQFLVHCMDEIRKMRWDEVASNYYMYNMALRGFSYKIAERNHVPHHIFDKVLDKLLKGQYPVYCDLIVSGICSPYLNKKFAEMCSSVLNTGRAVLNFDTFFYLSFYLSHADMLNMMLACYPDSIWIQILKRWQSYSKCSVM